MGRKIQGSKQKAFRILEILINKKADNPVILDLREQTYFCDYFIICSASSQRQVKAIYEEVIKSSRKNKIRIHHYEDDPSLRWFLLDYGDVVLHIFDEEARNFYQLERLWKNAKRVRIPKNFKSS